MNITNNKNFDEAFVNSITNGKWYSGEKEKFQRDYSVTEILNPVRIVLLTKRHNSEMTVDVSQALNTLFGSAVHLVLERAMLSSPKQLILSRVREFFDYFDDNSNIPEEQIMDSFKQIVVDGSDKKSIPSLLLEMKNDDVLVEKRLKYTTKSGKVLSGGFDLFDKRDNTLHDYKFTSIFTWIYRNRPGSRLKEYEKQLNIYRFLLDKVGIVVDNLKIHMIFRDYSKSKAKYDRDYPNEIETANLEIYGLDIVEAMIEDKVNELEQYKDVPDNQLPVCSLQERWATQTTFAVMKGKNVKASKVLFAYNAAKDWVKEECLAQAIKKDKTGNQEDIEALANKLSADYTIVKREGQNLRCEDWCGCKQFCDFYKNNVEK